MKRFLTAALLFLGVSAPYPAIADLGNLSSPGYRCDPAASAPSSFSNVGAIGVWCPSTGPNAGKLVLREGGVDSVIGAESDVFANPVEFQSYIKLDSIPHPGFPSLGQIYFHAFTVGSSIDQWMTHTSDGEHIVGNSDNTVIVYNSSGGTIGVAAPVYVTGSNSGIPTIAKARANAAATSPLLGLVFSSGGIANNSYGRVMRLGVLKNVDTSAFSVGDQLYLSTATAGALQNTYPTYPNYVAFAGVVLTSNASTGSIAVDCSGSAVNAAAIGSVTSIASPLGSIDVTSGGGGVEDVDVDLAHNFAWTGQHTWPGGLSSGWSQSGIGTGINSVAPYGVGLLGNGMGGDTNTPTLYFQGSHGLTTDQWYLHGFTDGTTGGTGFDIHYGSGPGASAFSVNTVGNATVSGTISVDGRVVDPGSGSVSTNYVLAWNGSAFVPASLSSFGVTSVSNSDGTLTVSPTTGAVVASLALGHANNWTGVQTFSAAPVFAAGATASGSSAFNLGGSTGSFTSPTGTFTFGDTTLTTNGDCVQNASSLTCNGATNGGNSNGGAFFLNGGHSTGTGHGGAVDINAGNGTDGSGATNGTRGGLFFDGGGGGGLAGATSHGGAGGQQLFFGGAGGDTIGAGSTAGAGGFHASYGGQAGSSAAGGTGANGGDGALDGGLSSGNLGDGGTGGNNGSVYIGDGYFNGAIASNIFIGDGGVPNIVVGSSGVSTVLADGEWHVEDLLKITNAYAGAIGSALTAASTIAPVTPITHVTGTTTVNTITPPTGYATTSYGGCITLIDDSATPFSASGNIAVAFTGSPNQAYQLCYDNGASKWYPMSSGAASGSGGSGTVTSVATGTGLTGGTITTTGTISLANTAVTAGSYTTANITVDAQGRITAASSGSSGALYGNSGQKQILVVPLDAVAQTSSSATASAVGAVSLNPSDYTLAQGTGFLFSSQSIVLRAVAATGNTTVTGHVQLYDVTAAVSIKTFNFTNSTTESKQEQTLSTAGSASANTLATADHILEIRIYVDSPSLSTDTLTLFSAEIRFIQTV